MRRDHPIVVDLVVHLLLQDRTALWFIVHSPAAGNLGPSESVKKLHHYHIGRKVFFALNCMQWSQNKYIRISFFWTNWGNCDRSLIHFELWSVTANHSCAKLQRILKLNQKWILANASKPILFPFFSESRTWTHAIATPWTPKLQIGIFSESSCIGLQTCTTCDSGTKTF